MVNRKVRVTLSGWFYMGLIFVFGLAAINTGNNLLYLILSVMISILIASFWLSEMALSQLKLSRRIPEAVFAGEEFSVIYELHNARSFFPLAGVAVSEKFGGKTASGYFLLVRAGRAEQVYASITLERRGRAALNELFISTRFPFGFFDKGKRIKLPDQILVLPAGVPAGIDAEAAGLQSGMIHGGKKGPGSELLCFRPYAPGDHPHWIDWKATARSGEILVKENEQEAEQSLTIILNIPPARPEPDSPERENLIARSFALARAYLDRGYRVRLELAGRGIDFGTGLAHFRRIGFFLALFDDREHPDPGEKLTAQIVPSFECVVGASQGVGN